MESVRNFIEICANKLGWQDAKSGKSIIWEGTGLKVKLAKGLTQEKL